MTPSIYWTLVYASTVNLIEAVAQVIVAIALIVAEAGLVRQYLGKTIPDVVVVGDDVVAETIISVLETANLSWIQVCPAHFRGSSRLVSGLGSRPGVGHESIVHVPPNHDEMDMIGRLTNRDRFDVEAAWAEMVETPSRIGVSTSDQRLHGRVVIPSSQTTPLQQLTIQTPDRDVHLVCRAVCFINTRQDDLVEAMMDLDHPIAGVVTRRYTTTRKGIQSIAESIPSATASATASATTWIQEHLEPVDNQDSLIQVDIHTLVPVMYDPMCGYVIPTRPPVDVDLPVTQEFVDQVVFPRRPTWSYPTIHIDLLPSRYPWRDGCLIGRVLGRVLKMLDSSDGVGCPQP